MAASKNQSARSKGYKNRGSVDRRRESREMPWCRRVLFLLDVFVRERKLRRTGLRSVTPAAFQAPSRVEFQRGAGNGWADDCDSAGLGWAGG